MKLNFGRRLVLFVHWLLSLAGCALAVTLVVWPACMETALALLEREGLVLKIYAAAVVVVYLIFAVGAVCIIFGGRKQRDKNAFIVVDSSETGHTRIAVGAVHQMIRQAVRGVDGIAEMRAGITNNGDSIDISADVALINGAHVPTVTANIKRAIQGYIERNCGVDVRGVSVNVHSLTDAEQAGKRGRKRKTEVYVNPTPAGNANADFGQSDFARNEPGAITQPLPEIQPMDEPEQITARIPDLPSEPEAPAAPEESESIALTLDAEPEPAEEPWPAEAAPEEEPAEAAPVAEEPAVEEPAPEAPAPKKGFFGRLFGKRSTPAPAEEAPAVPEVPTDVGAVSEESAPTPEETSVSDEDLDIEEVPVSEGEDEQA